MGKVPGGRMGGIIFLNLKIYKNLLPFCPKVHLPHDEMGEKNK